MKNLLIKRVKNKYPTDNDIKKLIYYITGERKEKNVKYWATLGYRNDPQKVVKDFIRTQRVLEKVSGIRAVHLIVSFSREQLLCTDAIDFYKAKIIGQRIAEYFFTRFHVIFAVHNDSDHLHLHFVINSVSYVDGRKWHQSKKEFAQMKKDIQMIAENVLSDNVDSILI